jgi:Uma2 family endonuclease
MATPVQQQPALGRLEPELYNGDRMTQSEFHAAYELTPEGFKAELIGGRVFLSSPLKANHGRNTLPLGTVLCHYEAKTSGVEALDNATVILSEVDEPQPDLSLRILPEYGGRSRLNAAGYIEGPPELLIEIAHSSWSIDLNDKRSQYAAGGVLEYLVVNLRDRRLHWFDLAANQVLQAGADGIVRVRTFPGLWIDSSAVLERNLDRLLAVLNQGLATPDHAEFVARLAAQNIDRRL